MKAALTTMLLTLLVLGGCTTTIRDEFNPSPQRAESMIVAYDDFRLCEWSFNKTYGALRSKEHQYRFKKPVVEEIKRRNLDCKEFPEFKEKKDWIEDWVNEYEVSLNQ